MYVSKIHPENFEIDIVHNLYTTQRAAEAKVGRIEWMKNFRLKGGGMSWQELFIDGTIGYRRSMSTIHLI